MKKLLILMLTLVMIFSFAACKKKCKDQHVDENLDGICDVCEKEVPIPHTVHTDDNADGLCDSCSSVFIDYAKPTTVGTLLKKSIEKQFETTKSAKLSFNVHFVNEREDWEILEEYDEALDTIVATEEQEKYYSEVLLTLDVWLNRDADSVDLKLSGNVQSRNSIDDEFRVVEDATYYIMDGYFYAEETDGIYSTVNIIPDNIDELLDQFFEIELLSNEKKSELLTSLGVEMATVFNIKDKFGSTSFDAKPALDDLLSFLKDLDPEKDTVGALVDKLLSLVADGLTSAELVDKLESLSALTVAEALTEIDTWLTENHGTTVQGIYDSVVNDENFVSFFMSYLILDDGLNYDDPYDKEYIDMRISDLQSVNFAELIESLEVANVPLYDVVASSIPTDSEDSAYPTSEEFFKMVRDFLAMPVGEFEEGMGVRIFSPLKNFASEFTVNRLNGRLDLNFEGILNITAVNGELNVDISRNYASEIEGKSNKERVLIEVKASVTELSESENKIALPEGTKALSELIGRSLYDENYNHFSSYLDVEDGEVIVDIYMYITHPDYNYISIGLSAYDIPAEDFDDNKITVRNYSVSYDSYSLAVPEGAEFTVTFDVENNTFVLDSHPTYDVPTPVANMLHAIAIGDKKSFEGVLLSEEIALVSLAEGGFCIKLAESSSYIENVYVSVSYNKSIDGIECTITGFTTAKNKYLYYTDKSNSWFGGCYDLYEIDAYFGGDPTFGIYLDEETNTLVLTEIPDVIDEYKV